MEETMCHYRSSYASESATKAEAERRKELEAKRGQAVDKLMRDATVEPARTSPGPAPVKESIPAK